MVLKLKLKNIGGISVYIDILLLDIYDSIRTYRSVIHDWNIDIICIE